MAIPHSWTVDPEDGSFTRYQNGQLQRLDTLSDADRGISFAMSEIEALLSRTSRSL